MPTYVLGPTHDAVVVRSAFGVRMPPALNLVQHSSHSRRRAHLWRQRTGLWKRMQCNVTGAQGSSVSGVSIPLRFLTLNNRLATGHLLVCIAANLTHPLIFDRP